MGRGLILPTAGEIDVEKIRPLGDYLLVRTFEKEKTEGGIILPKGERSECRFGEVVASGPGESGLKTGFLRESQFKKGDYILVMDYAGERMEVDGESYRFLHLSGVWAKVKFAGKSETLSVKELTPVTDHVLVKLADEEKSKGGILLPSAPHLSYARAEVVKVNPEGKYFDAKTEQTEVVGVSPGDKIVMLRYAGAIVTVDGTKYRIIQTSDILCVEE